MNNVRYVRILPSRVLLGLALAVLLAGSFFLPNLVAGVLDSRILDVPIYTETQGFSFDASPFLSVPEKIDLIANRNIETIPLKTGQSMDTDAAERKAISELTRCFSGGPLAFDYLRCSVAEGGSLFVINTADPSVNMVVWEFVLEDPSESTMKITLDDETGVIIKVIYKRGAGAGATDSSGEQDKLPEGSATLADESIDGDELHVIALRLTEMMTKYYGLPVILSDYMLSGDLAYYKADLITSEYTVPMYGIVKAGSFTMNEQA